MSNHWFQTIFSILQFNPACLRSDMVWSIHSSIEISVRFFFFFFFFGSITRMTIKRLYFLDVLYLWRHIFYKLLVTIGLDLKYLLYETSWIGEDGNKQGIKVQNSLSARETVQVSEKKNILKKPLKPSSKWWGRDLELDRQSYQKQRERGRCHQRSSQGKYPW